ARRHSGRNLRPPLSRLLSHRLLSPNGHLDDGRGLAIHVPLRPPEGFDRSATHPDGACLVGASVAGRRAHGDLGDYRHVAMAIDWLHYAAFCTRDAAYSPRTVRRGSP